MVYLQDTGLEQEANDAAARVAGVGGDKEDRYSLDLRAIHQQSWLTCTMVCKASAVVVPEACTPTALRLW